MHALAVFLSLLLADGGTAPPDGRIVRTLELATLTPWTASAGRVGRFVFAPGSRPWVHAGRVLVEAAGRAGCLRCVEFAAGESEDGLDGPAPIIVEGVLVIVHHPARGQFPAVEEVLVREARRVRELP